MKSFSELTFQGTPSTIKFIPQVASKLPNLKIVINHIAKPFQIKFQPWADEMTAAAKHPNVYCKLSGMVTEVDPENHQTPWGPQTFK